MNHFLLIKHTNSLTVKLRYGLTITLFVVFQWLGTGGVVGQVSAIVTYDNEKITIKNNNPKSKDNLVIIFGGGAFVGGGAFDRNIEKVFAAEVKNKYKWTLAKIENPPSPWCGMKESFKIIGEEEIISGKTNCASIKNTLKLYTIKRVNTGPSMWSYELHEIEPEKINFVEANVKKVEPKTEEPAIAPAEKITDVVVQEVKTPSNIDNAKKENTQALPKKTPQSGEKKPLLNVEQETKNLQQEVETPEDSLPEYATSTPAEESSDLKTERKKDTTPYVLLSVVGILLILMVIGVIFYLKTYLKNKKIEEKASKKKAREGTGLVLEEEEVISYATGISDIQEEAGVDYYEIDMRSIFNDTAIQYVYFSRKCILDIYRFFSNFLKLEEKTNETGCFLIGRWDYADAGKQTYNISLETIVEPSDDAVYGEYELNFGAKIGINLQYEVSGLREKTGKEYVHTAWMHSHPGLGLFLSSQDLNVQSQLAYRGYPGRMLAIVVDSNTDDFKTAFFTPKHTGVMNNDTDLKQLLSLETLYQWAKKAPAALNVNKQNYYDIRIQAEKSKVNTVSFSRAAIIDMDAAIEPGSTGLRGYFYGIAPYKEDPTNKSMFLDNFQTIESFGNDRITLGCLLVVQRFSRNEIIENYLPVINRFDLFSVYSIETENMYIVSKNTDGNYSGKENETASVSLMDMKVWTRKKRE